MFTHGTLQFAFLCVEGVFYGCGKAILVDKELIFFILFDVPFA
jgi:hypothetical protein